MKGMEKYHKIFYLYLVIIFILACYMLGGSVNTGSGYYHDYKVQEWKDGWFVEGSEQEVMLPTKSNGRKNEYVGIYRYLKEDTGEESLCFRTDHSYVRVYADDELIYTFGNKEEIPFGKTPGSIWNIIPLHHLKAGTRLTVYVMSPYAMYSGKIRTMVMGNRADILLYIFKDSAPLILITIIPIIVAFFLILIHFCFRKNFAPMIFLNAAVCYFLLALWSFTETRGWQFFFDNAYVIQMINFISFSMVISSIAVCLNQMGVINNEKHYRILLTIDFLVPISQIIIQILGIADFFEMLAVVHILDAANIFVFGMDFIIDIYKKKRDSKNLILSIIMYLTTFLSLLLDLLEFYIWDKFGNGFFSRIELLIIITVAGVCAVKQAISMYAENIEKLTYQRMAYTDDMTGMKNRRAFDRDTEAMEKDSDTVAILYADMNGLKQINDNMGHQKGDEAIKTVADKLLYFGEQGNFCYRLGGDEFCVIASNLTARKMEEECARINQELKIYQNDYIYGLSIAYGAKDYKPEQGEKLSDVMRSADKKMYEKKQKMKEDIWKQK